MHYLEHAFIYDEDYLFSHSEGGNMFVEVSPAHSFCSPPRPAFDQLHLLDSYLPKFLKIGS